MLEGSFRPSSSATGLHPQYPIPKSGYAEQPSPAANMRKDHPGPSFTPVHDRPLSSHSPDYESEDHQQSGSPPGHAPHFFKSHPSMASHPQSNQSSVHQAASELPQSSSIPKLDGRPPQEVAPKNSNIGPVRAKKKPAGSACNSCHRLKTRCSGGHPCDRCAAHKVACQFDRDLIYRSPLASSSQQASARNAHAMSKGETAPAGKPRSRSGPKAGRKFPPASNPGAVSQSAPTAPMLPMALPQVTQLSAPSLPTLSAPIAHQPGSFSAAPPKQGNKSTPISTPQPPEGYANYEPNLSHPNGLHVRLAALENSVSGLLQVLRAHQSTNPSFLPPAAEPRPPLSPPTPPTLVVSGSSSTFGPEKDQPNDPNRLGAPCATSGLGDPLSEGILPAMQLQYLYDVFVEFCLPSLPILHAVQIASIRARSSFLFSVMVAIGARFCSSQSVAHIPPKNCLMSNSTGARVDLSQVTIDEATYARLVTLAHQHLSNTLLKATHSLEDVRAILFLACWALVSNEDPNGAPNRWVLIGHAGRIGRSIGLDRCTSELRGSSDIWNNPELHETRRVQLDAIKTDHALQAIETILSSNLRLEPSRDYFPPLHVATEREPSFTIVKLSNGSPSQYDVVSAAQIESLAELAEIWAAANSFLSVADDRSRNLTSEQLIELGEHHNKVMDAWAKKWTWHGSSWAPLLGANLRTIRLLSESLRITLNLAFTNVLYAIAAVSRLPPKFHETLAMAIERVNGSSTAVIQAHRDSVREGFSLAFAPDLVTDGLVSAAITVLQLASPIGLPAMIGKPSGKEIKKRTLNPSGSSSNLENLAREERLPTPQSGEDRADVDMNEANASSSGGPQPHILMRPSHESRASSPSSTPRRLSKSSSPRMAFFSADGIAGGNQMLGKKCFMEPPVAAHYIRMATDVLQSSDRSQTRLGTIMASKIMKLATQAGLMGSPSSSNLVGPTSNTSHSPGGGMVSHDERPSISSTSSLSSTRHATISSAEHPDVNPHPKSKQDGVIGLDSRATDVSNPESSLRQAEDDDEISGENIHTASQQRAVLIAQPGPQDPDFHDDENEDEPTEGNEMADDNCDGDGEADEEDQITGDSYSAIHHEQQPSEKDGQDMMEEDQQ
ncbi:uncharacterized protein PGTG_06371 [Puccinia graminis f. sp. tritici CRL 75-36-700-3]|uniref:Zn(2)-C6 fungal-type domain-containing protein n=1 Tax=Puccinia graminis f. sp. tritici (strain CRL 75-36-700-3 / race SCCL) TaxID=418459 RepID=E3K814_PUCGT|nr:uncharacterized protein PGTG_06371 [Puccinia graminis f. sp. tritici CRL 75-36-700-3]EFP80415.2 hypothetical protein PGTG_06371 [Puccinia graminis f. sp. tritici CRL 75-36-700-3]